MIFHFRIPDAEVLGYERTKALYRLLEAVCTEVARDQGLDRGLLASWEAERLSAAWSRVPEPQSFKAPPLSLVPGRNREPE